MTTEMFSGVFSGLFSGAPAAAPDVLSRARDAVAPATRAALTRLDETSAAIASYHLGWTDAGGAPTSGGGGKAVRPALSMLSARAAGAPARVGIPGAVAVELVHNFSLVHDDVMDGDTERRHRPTV
ncbi:MAG: polyprenyl synthetase family protein, partial [Pseudonocardiaceae bacterium]